MSATSGASSVTGRRVCPVEMQRRIAVPGFQPFATYDVITANLVPAAHLAQPGHGVYAAWAHGHMAAVNVGVRPTFETGRGLLVEAYLLDFDGDLYGKRLVLELWERLRDEAAFPTEEALVAQIGRDVEAARASRRPGADR